MSFLLEVISRDFLLEEIDDKTAPMTLKISEVLAVVDSFLKPCTQNQSIFHKLFQTHA